MNTSTQHIHAELIERYPALVPVGADIEAVANSFIECASGGGTILVCGNGGSAADADHIVGELQKSFRLPRPLPQDAVARLEKRLPPAMHDIPKRLQRGVRAISLASHTALMTAFGNDVAAELAYAQQVSVLARPGDLVVGISTSGQATNVCAAIAVAAANDISTVALTGRDGGPLARLADVAVIAPGNETHLIQELHLPIYHAICAMVEQELYG